MSDDGSFLPLHMCQISRNAVPFSSNQATVALTSAWNSDSWNEKRSTSKGVDYRTSMGSLRGLFWCSPLGTHPHIFCSVGNCWGQSRKIYFSNIFLQYISPIYFSLGCHMPVMFSWSLIVCLLFVDGSLVSFQLVSCHFPAEVFCLLSLSVIDLCGLRNCEFPELAGSYEKQGRGAERNLVLPPASTPPRRVQLIFSRDIQISGKASIRGPGWESYRKQCEEKSIRVVIDSLISVEAFIRNDNLTISPKIMYIEANWSTDPMIRSLVHEPIFYVEEVAREGWTIFLFMRANRSRGVYSLCVDGDMGVFLHTEWWFSCFVIRTKVSEEIGASFIQNKQGYHRHLSWRVYTCLFFVV